jgi:predicted restriction endonuclease
MALSASIRKAVYQRDNYRCRVCNNSNGLHPHHIKYKSAGGTDTLDNLLTVCFACHRAIHDGFLKVIVQEVCSKFEGSYTVKFERMRGWTL